MDFVLSMTEVSIWDIFSEPFMKKGQVKALPALATKNLQTATETVWYADSSFNETLGVQLYWKVDHFHCWVIGNWTDFTKHYSHKWKTVGYQIPLSISIFLPFMLNKECSLVSGDMLLSR